MNFHYDKESDSLYIALSAQTSAESEEVAPGVVVDYNDKGNIVGLDIEDASQHATLGKLTVRGFSPTVDLQPL